MSRIACPACSKSHNNERKASACRAAKAAALTRKGAVISRPLPPPQVRHFTGMSAHIRRPETTRESVIAYVHQQSRDNAIGGTCD